MELKANIKGKIVDFKSEQEFFDYIDSQQDLSLMNCYLIG